MSQASNEFNIFGKYLFAYTKEDDMRDNETKMSFQQEIVKMEIVLEGHREDISIQGN